MRLINKKYLIILTSILLVIISVLVLKQTKIDELSEVKLLEASNNTSFAMYKEDGDVYTEVEGNTFPEGYVLNINKSKCIDNNGNEIKDVLSYEDNQVKLTSNKTAYCYLYFDLNSLVNKLLIDKNEGAYITYMGDLWRYQGNGIINNYICFGTDENCSTNDEDISKYMYRIVGITPDGSLKLVKEINLITLSDGSISFQFSINDKENLEDCGTEGEKCTWPDTMLFKRLNGISNGTVATPTGDSNIFIGNDYYEYLADSKWLDLIENRLWRYGNVKDLYNYNGNEMYLAEKAFTTDKTILGTEPKARIGLLYLSDYYFAYKTNDTNGGNPGSISEVSNAWIYFKNNSRNTGNFEWLLNGYGISSTDTINHWFFSNAPDKVPLHNFDTVRPVFYLTKDITLNGNGSKDNPYIIKTSN